jgi:ketosteroid isomerase-like protein
MKTLVWAIVLTALIVAAAACGSAPPASDPGSAIKGFYNAFNTRDVDRALTFLADDAVMAEYVGATYQGKPEIRSTLQFEAGRSLQMEISNLRVSGDKVTYHIKVSVGSEAALAREVDVEAIVQGGKIKSFVDVAAGI